MYSILYTDSNPSQGRLSIDEELLESYLSPLAGFYNSKKREKRHFVSVLKTPLASAEEIYFRQEIFRDFLQYPDLLKTLSEFAEEIVSQHKQSLDTKQRMTASRIVQGQAITDVDKLHSTFAMLQEECVAFCSLMVHITELQNKLKQFEPRSAGLKRLVDFISQYSMEHPAVRNAAETCKYLSDLTETEFWKYSNITVHHVEDLQFEFIDISFSEEPSMKSMFAKQLLPEKEYKTILNRSCENLRSQLKKLFESAFSSISNLHKELDFYRLGLALKEAMDQYKIPCTFPEICDHYNIKDLYDLRLQMKLGATPMDARSVTLKDGFCFITGANNSGKTVFLRSLLMAQLFAQSGLFLPATAAKIPIYSNIVVLFAAEESRNPMGRFEHEVRQLAEVNLWAEPENTLVILNEMFQSAPYQEGSEALFSILKHWEKRDIHWIAVTHLDLLKQIEQENINHIHFTKQY